MCISACIRVQECPSSRVSACARPLVPGACAILVRKDQRSSIAPAGPRGSGDKVVATRPALSFSARARLLRLPACSRVAGRVRKVPGAALSFPGRGEWGGGPSRERTPAGRGDRSGAGCARDGHDLEAAAVAICHRSVRVGGRPGIRGAFPVAQPVQGRRRPAHSGAERRAEGALTLARQVGGGGAGSAGRLWAVRVAAL